jgi:hypothetical protein
VNRDSEAERMPEDQVPRLKRFRDSHPDITVIPPGGLVGQWVARRAGEMVASDLELRGLLDQLERLT